MSTLSEPCELDLFERSMEAKCDLLALQFSKLPELARKRAQWQEEASDLSQEDKVIRIIARAVWRWKPASLYIREIRKNRSELGNFAEVFYDHAKRRVARKAIRHIIGTEGPEDLE